MSADAACLIDVFDQWLNVVHTAMATRSDDSEDSWSQAVGAAKEACAIIASSRRAFGLRQLSSDGPDGDS